MGLLDILNGMQNGPRGQTEPGKGGMSPITMAALALLAYKAYKKLNTTQPGTAPAGNAPGGNLGSGPGGALGGGLGGLLQGGLGGLLRGGAGNTGGLGGLGGLLAGGAAGSILSGGLNDLLHRFQEAGHGEVAKSWVGTGPNRDIAASDLRSALGDDTVNTLAQQAGISQVELLDGLSQQLPQFVDQLTPNGRVPTEHEMSSML